MAANKESASREQVLQEQLKATQETCETLRKVNKDLVEKQEAHDHEINQLRTSLLSDD